MVLRELSESEWQHSFVSVLKLAGSHSSSNKRSNNSGDPSARVRENAVGDVKHIMVREERTRGTQRETERERNGCVMQSLLRAVNVERQTRIEFLLER